MIPIFPSAAVAITAFLIPFTPRWLAIVGRDTDCLNTIAKIRSLPKTDIRVQREWMEVLAEVAFENRVTAERHPTLVGSKTFVDSLKLELAAWKELFRSGCLRRTHVGAMIALFQQWVGIGGILYYTPTLLEYVFLVSESIMAALTSFRLMGIDLQLSLKLTGLIYVAAFVFVLPALWTLDLFGRRPLLLGGALVATATLAILAAMIGVYGKDWEHHRAAGWVAVAMMCMSSPAAKDIEVCLSLTYQLVLYAMNFAFTYGPAG